MSNRIMRLLVLFDLPTGTPEERREYMQFRKFLIKDGYDMLQYSVYSRITANHDDANLHLAHIRCHLPPAGSIRALLVTEKQYASMYILLGQRTATENLLRDNDVVEF